MKRNYTLLILLFLFGLNIFGQKLILPESQPFFNDTIWQGAADPTILWNPVKKEFYIWYTQRRANLEKGDGVEWMHGSSIGIAASKDGKAWRYVGICSGNEGLGSAEKKGVTWWAPSVIYDGKLFHMYVSYVPGIFRDWNAKRFIKHFTSIDGDHWVYQATLSLSSEHCIDACVYKLKNKWMMVYKDEKNDNHTWMAESNDLYHWKVLGAVIKDVGHEAPYVWKERKNYYMIVDAWDKGLRIYESKNGISDWQYFCTVDGCHPAIFRNAGKSYIIFHSGFNSQNEKCTALYIKELKYYDNRFYIE